MKRIIFIALILLGVVAPTTYAQISKKKVAVYMTGEIEESYKKVIGAKLVSAITATDEYAAVERTADFLAALASEQDYQTSEEVRDSQIASIGQRFGVLYVVVADVNEIFSEMFISARLINVETGLVEKSADEAGNPTNMSSLIDLSNKIANKLLLGTAVAVSNKPINFSLCALRDNKIFYITKEKWEKMDNDTKSSYQKIGICLINGNQKVIFKGALKHSFDAVNGMNDAADFSWTSFIKTNSYLIESLIRVYGCDISTYPDNGWFTYKGNTTYLRKKKLSINTFDGRSWDYDFGKNQMFFYYIVTPISD